MLVHLVVVDPASLVSERVLVDLDDVPVLQDLDELGADLPEVVGHDEGRREHGPHRHLRLGLLDAQGEVADDELESCKFQLFVFLCRVILYHVGVVPVSRSCVLGKIVLLVPIMVDDVHNVTPTVLQISRRKTLILVISVRSTALH